MAQNKLDVIAEHALWVSIIAIVLSASAIVWSISRVKTMEQQVAHLEGSVDLLQVRYTNLLAWLEARGIEVQQ